MSELFYFGNVAEDAILIALGDGAGAGYGEGDGYGAGDG